MDSSHTTGGGGRDRAGKKKEGEELTIEGLIGIAVGRFGLGYRETLLLRPSEFESIACSYKESREAHEREAWERTRLLAAMLLQPHSTKTLDARRLLPLPWDNPPTDKRQMPPVALKSSPEAFIKAVEAANIMAKD